MPDTGKSFLHGPKVKWMIAGLAAVLLLAGGAGIAIFTGREPLPQGISLQALSYDPLAVMPEDKAALAALIRQKTDAAAQAEDVRIRCAHALSVDEIGGTLSAAQRALLSFLSEEMSAAASDLLSEEEISGIEEQPALPDFSALSDPVETKTQLDGKDGSVVSSLSFSGSGVSRFQLPGASLLAEKVREETASVVAIGDSHANPIAAQIVARTDGVTQRLKALRVTVTYEVGAELSFTGDLAALGDQRIFFHADCTVEYTVDYPGVWLDESLLYLKAGDRRRLEPEIVLPPGETEETCQIEWMSTAPEILSVNEKGEIVALKTDENSVGVTVYLTCGERTYYDFCEIYVTELTRRVALSDKKISLAPGEKFRLSGEAAPEDAPMSALHWQSADPSIAAVTQTGEVTAFAPGNTVIVAFSEDGAAYALCKVKVAPADVSPSDN